MFGEREVSFLVYSIDTLGTRAMPDMNIRSKVRETFRLQNNMQNAECFTPSILEVMFLEA